MTVAWILLLRVLIVLLGWTLLTTRIHDTIVLSNAFVLFDGALLDARHVKAVQAAPTTTRLLLSQQEHQQTKMSKMNHGEEDDHDEEVGDGGMLLLVPRRNSQTNTETGSRSNINATNFYIRQAEEKDLQDASWILTRAFFGFNFLTTPLEWLKTYLSLRDTFLEARAGTCHPNQHLNKYCMLVACHGPAPPDSRKTRSTVSNQADAIIGICEIDGRRDSSSTAFVSKPSRKTIPNTTTSTIIPSNTQTTNTTAESNLVPRPYMCNLAVAANYRRKGIGQALIRYCEEVARMEWKESFIYLRVRETNEIALGMYTRLGYVAAPEDDCDNIPTLAQTGQDRVLLLRKKL